MTPEVLDFLKVVRDTLTLPEPLNEHDPGYLLRLEGRALDVLVAVQGVLGVHEMFPREEDPFAWQTRYLRSLLDRGLPLDYTTWSDGGEPR